VETDKNMTADFKTDVTSESFYSSYDKVFI